MIVPAFISLLLVIVELVWGTSNISAIFGTAIWIIFIARFALRLAAAPGKLRFLRKNWVTVLALAVPALRIFRAFRFLRLARAARSFRLLSIVGTANRGMNALRHSPGSRAPRSPGAAATSTNSVSQLYRVRNRRTEMP